jgi:hypothetical protein
VTNDERIFSFFFFLFLYSWLFLDFAEEMDEEDRKTLPLDDSGTAQIGLEPQGIGFRLHVRVGIFLF